MKTKIPEKPFRPRIAILALFVVYVTGGLVGCKDEGPARPNLVLVTVDRLAADRLSCFGGASDAGGSVCALGQRGTLFAWAASPGRGEASSAATVLTGLPEAVHGVGDDGQSFLAYAQPSIAKDLSSAGYATAAFVTSPRVNRSRHLDPGFDLYDDRIASPNRTNSVGSVDLSGMVRSWVEAAPSPWFIWIHADRDAGLVELDRLFSRLSQTLDGEDGGPGILFLSLRGEPKPLAAGGAATPEADRSIEWRTHRVPLIWRPPTHDRPLEGGPRDGSVPALVSRRLASLMDIAPTLRAAAQIPSSVASIDRDGALASPSRPRRGAGRGAGRDLSAGERSQASGGATSEERFLLLQGMEPGSDVGLASRNHLYTRRASPLDGTGRPVETSSLIPLAARFATLPEPDSPHDPRPTSARLEPGPWRTDVLDAESPVPRLEFHLARLLAAQRNER